MERTPTGIKGLDDMLDGGLIPNSNILLCGPPGSGKTNFGLNFLYMGAEKYGERGLYLSLEQSKESIIQNAKLVFPSFNWDAHIGKDIIIESPGHQGATRIPAILKEKIEGADIKRVFIDSITVMKLFSHDVAEYRAALFELLEFIKPLNCTTILSSETSYSDREKAEFSVEEFVVDGVIILYTIPKGELRYRGLEILKMRGIDHKMKLVPFKIAPSGIIVYPVESVFWVSEKK